MSYTAWRKTAQRIAIRGFHTPTCSKISIGVQVFANVRILRIFVII